MYKYGDGINVTMADTERNRKRGIKPGEKGTVIGYDIEDEDTLLYHIKIGGLSNLFSAEDISGVS